jgi:hypothetical protein
MGLQDDYFELEEQIPENLKPALERIWETFLEFETEVYQLTEEIRPYRLLLQQIQKSLDVPLVIKTDLDLRNELWPRSLPVAPQIGDQIESMTERVGGNLRLRVVSVFWRCSKELGRAEVVATLADSVNRTKAEFYEMYAAMIGEPLSSFTWGE